MTLFVVDSKNVFGKSVGEAGRYNVRILPDSECKKTSRTQEDMAVLNYEVLDGKYAGGKILYDNLVWKNDDVETSAKRFNTVLAAIGVPDGTPIASIEKLVQALKGKQLNIAVDWEHSEYTGKWNLSVKGYYKVDQEGSKPNGVERPNGAPKQNGHSNSHPAQQTLTGVDPFADSMNYNDAAMTITDDDLPF
ncbi:DUF669 domain-containing protein [Enterococcus asini]|uniref:DUF669 domain-containing protein n=1 Tax=Enterococcus asini TaxID=57732 RepID=UPI001E3810B7|nr:DUF669 domain-containing protein [Enterococcus asini]MCD5029086.1 DUF669 domain-containing protein [Enterococcus asini]